MIGATQAVVFDIRYIGFVTRFLAGFPMLVLFTNFSKRRQFGVLSGKSLQECPFYAGVPQRFMLDLTVSCYASIIFLTMLTVILLSVRYVSTL